MPELTPLPITPPPGVVLTESLRAAEGRWIASDYVRFVNGRPQKIGGHVLAYTDPTSGQPRTLHAWRDLSVNQFLAAGTYRKLYVYDQNGLQNDVTPIRSSGTLGNNPLTTQAGSAIVTVAHAGHGLVEGDQIVIAGATAVGGITPNGTFTVNTVDSVNQYTYVFTSPASGGATGGGAAVTFSYEINIGTELAVFGLGYGVGGYGLGTYGTARSSSTIATDPRVWSLDHFGKLLLAAYNGGTLYSLDPDSLPTRAAIITDAPDDIRAMFVTPERFVFALRDAMVLSWCSQGDPSTWTPAVNNTANSRTLTEGTKLVTGRVLGPLISVVWTDAALYVFQYTGSSFIYDSRLVAKNCGAIGPNAVCSTGGMAFWMGTDNFWMYNGQVTPMPRVEDIRKHVFDELNLQTGYQVSATYVPKYNDIVFSYTVTGQTSPSKTIVFNITTQCWFPWNIARVSGTFFTQGDTRPYLGSPDGYIYQHEVGQDAAGVAIPWTLTLAPYAMVEGYQRLDVQQFLLDFHERSGDIDLTLNSYDRVADDQNLVIEDTETDTFSDANNGIFDTRLSGRYVGFTLTQDVLGGYFRLGKPVAFVMPAGVRS